MNTKACMALAIAAGCALAATANAQMQVGQITKMPKNALKGRVHVDMLTGDHKIERFARGQKPAPQEDVDPSIWANIDYVGNGNWYTSSGSGQETFDWGDIGSGGDPVNITCVDFFYCSIASGLIDIELSFYQKDNGINTLTWEWAQIDGGLGDAYFGFAGLPGGSGGALACWIVTVDFGGQGFPFTINGDTDGDGDHDFAWGMRVTAGDPGLTTGGVLALPGFGDTGIPWSAVSTSFGVADLTDTYATGAHTGYSGTWWFGGANPPAVPYASFYLNLYGKTGGAGCYADCEGDGDLDVFDFLCFQNEHSNQTAYGDCENDGDWDIFDFLCYQNAYSNGCP